jgi:hypothetical protein
MKQETNFKYDKDNLFAEFNVAKDKDIKMSKKKSQDDKENDVFKNRVQFFKDHIELKRSNPAIYEMVDINFDNLLLAYQSANPRDWFYMKVFGMTYAQKMSKENLEEKASKEADAKKSKEAFESIH